VRALQYVFWNLGSIVNFVFAVIGIAATDSLYASNGLFPLDLIMIFMKLLMVQLVPLQVCVACSHRVSCFCFGCVLPLANGTAMVRMSVALSQVAAIESRRPVKGWRGVYSVNSSLRREMEARAESAAHLHRVSLARDHSR
jgi:hypothetical protein